MRRRINGLVEALPYINRFRGQTFVIKLGGELVADRPTLHGLAAQVTLLQRVGISIVVVHGGGPQADELSKRLGIEQTVIAGRRVTDDATLEVVKMVFAGKINTELISALRRAGAQAVGVSGVAGGIILARKHGIRKLVDPDTGEASDVDFGHVGDIVKVDTRLLAVLIREDFLPVLSCLGADEEGNIYNINADTIAAAIATSISAHKLVCLTNVPGILRDEARKRSVIPTLTLAEARGLIQKRVVSRGMLPKLSALVAAVEGGVARAHVLDGTSPHALLIETFTSQGAGTMIVASKEMKRYRKEELD